MKTNQSEKTRPICPVEERCGACQFLTIPYANQLADKQARLVALFADLADEQAVVHPIAGMENPYHYRNKVASPFAPGRIIKGKAGRRADRRTTPQARGKQKRAAEREKPQREVLCGMYAAGTHRIVPTDSCLIENEVAKRIILTIRDLLPAFGIEPYREDTNTGFLRHAIVRVGHESREVLVTLVTNGKQFPGSKHFAQALVKRCPEVTSIVQNINTRQTNVILGEHEMKLYGPGFILDRLCGLSFRISSQSFYQVNVAQTEVLYERAIELACLTGSETVIDAYCGTGTIGLVAAKGVVPSAAVGHDSGVREKSAVGADAGSPASVVAGVRRHAAQVIGVDEVPAAIRDARMNARHNGIGNAEFTVADAGTFMRELAAAGHMADTGSALRERTTIGAGIKEDGIGAIDVVLMDPPRAGATEEFLEAVAMLAPKRVVYISCNPATQVRDVAHLVEHGYRIEAMQPVDMFPHTDHVENIVVCIHEGGNAEAGKER